MEIDKMFSVMFPDSEMVTIFKCGEKNTAYLAQFGTAPYFKNELIASISGPCSVMFDESLNIKYQSKQIDIHVRYWCGQEFVARYLTSEFLVKEQTLKKKKM